MYLKQTLARCSVVADESKAILHQSSDVPPFFLLLLSFCPYFHFMLFYSHFWRDFNFFCLSLLLDQLPNLLFLASNVVELNIYLDVLHLYQKQKQG